MCRNGTSEEYQQNDTITQEMPTAASIATLRHGFDGILAVSSKLAQDVLVCLVLHFVEVGLSACPKVKGLQKAILGVRSKSIRLGHEERREREATIKMLTSGRQ